MIKCSQCVNVCHPIPCDRFFRNDKKKRTKISARKFEEELVLLRFFLGEYFFFKILGKSNLPKLGHFMFFLEIFVIRFEFDDLFEVFKVQSLFSFFSWNTIRKIVNLFLQLSNTYYIIFSSWFLPMRNIICIAVLRISDQFRFPVNDFSTLTTLILNFGHFVWWHCLVFRKIKQPSPQNQKKKTIKLLKCDQKSFKKEDTNHYHHRH